MTKLEQLIEQLCPDGVEYKKLIEICDEIIVPMRDRPKDLSGSIPWCRIEDKEGQYFHKSLSGLGVSMETVNKMNLKVFPTGTVICSCSASLGAYAINTQPLITNQTFIGLVCNARTLNKYLLYYMETQTDKLRSMATTGTIPYISRKKFEELTVPLPPLEVQAEIVRILDKFTELTTELTTELANRKKQYEYYRDKVLSFNSDVETLPLTEIAEISTGSSNTNEGLAEGLYPFYVRSQEPLRKNEYEFDETAIITAGDGVGVGKVFHYVVGKYALHQRAYRIHITSPKVLPRYYFHYMRNTFLPYIQKTLFHGSVASIRRPMLNKFPVPVPPIEEQQRIVDILDRFDKLCNDISEGLPAEIEARQKQYEYYRDKLLTFKEGGTSET